MFEEYRETYRYAVVVQQEDSVPALYRPWAVCRLNGDENPTKPSQLVSSSLNLSPISKLKYRNTTTETGSWSTLRISLMYKMYKILSLSKNHAPKAYRSRGHVRNLGTKWGVNNSCRFNLTCSTYFFMALVLGTRADV
jgi:hypothetical protein